MKPTGPLAGIRIIDMSMMLLGPYATKLLADLGADVIKVEAPTGDGRRDYGPRRHPKMGGMFIAENRGKRSIVLDLKQPQGRDALIRLCRDADALLFNTRPQSMARLGLSWDALRAVNPRLVYFGATGFGQDGPYAARAAYDDIIQGLVALPDLEARIHGKPRYVPLNISDRNTGMSAAIALLAALLDRNRTGEGQAVEVPMFETMAEYVISEHLWGAVFEPPEGQIGTQRQFERRPAKTKDGYLCAMFATDAQLARFCREAGVTHLLADPRFGERAVRLQHLTEFYDSLDALFSSRTTAEWLPVLEAADVAAMPMNTLESVFDDPHLKAVGFFQEVDHPTEGRIRSLKNPIKWSKSQPFNPLPAPRLGEHSVEVLREAGFAAAEIDALIAAGITVDARTLPSGKESA